jgi:hypothetical protein
MHIVETSDKIFFIPSVQLVFTSIYLTVLLQPLERLGCVDSWRMSYDQRYSRMPYHRGGGAPEDINR